MQTQDKLLEANNFALVTWNEQKRLPSLIRTRDIFLRKYPRHRALPHVRVPAARALVAACPSTARSLSCARLRPAQSRVPACAPHARARPAARLACLNVHALAPEHPSEDFIESPDSQTLPRLFPRILRLGITFST
ncbi:hypothetical protein CRG98_011342 [Punica granatum]|uniref:Uncharacterized protein n=1 Tax=Punica granatum TaxID=22663 RepID=A0A2I0KIC0_PUNGR|nr:hypothetical protein CRG98_011342 [Punica granatum]